MHPWCPRFPPSYSVSVSGVHRKPSPTDEGKGKPYLKRLKAGVSNGGYHYLGAAKILAPIGKAFAEALVGVKRSSAEKPIKVFVFAGQSNMEGQGFLKADPKRTRSGTKGKAAWNT